MFVTNLSQCHLGDDGQHDLLPLGWIRILLVFVEPGLEGGCGLSGGVLPPGSQVSVASVTRNRSVTGRSRHQEKNFSGSKLTKQKTDLSDCLLCLHI